MKIQAAAKAQKLIHIINRAEIVKNFTNFTCGFRGGPITVWHHQAIGFPARNRRMSITVFCDEENN